VRASEQAAAGGGFLDGIEGVDKIDPLRSTAKALGAKGSQAVFLYSVSAFMSVHQRSVFCISEY
jgi:hypothetical protein